MAARPWPTAAANDRSRCEGRSTSRPSGRSHALASPAYPRRQVLALSGGSTTAEVARELEWRQDLTVVTNSLTIADVLGQRGRVRVLVTGGYLRPEPYELVGPVAEGTFGAIAVDTAVLGADGLTETGVTTHDETEARTNQAMVSAAQRTVVVVDGSKVGRVALARMARLDQVALVITDASADPAEPDRVRAASVEVVVAAPLA